MQLKKEKRAFLFWKIYYKYILNKHFFIFILAKLFFFAIIEDNSKIASPQNFFWNYGSLRPNKQKPVKNTRLFGLFHTSDPSLSRDNSRAVEVIVDDLITGLGPSFYTAKTWVYFTRWTGDFYMGKLFFSYLL